MKTKCNFKVQKKKIKQRFFPTVKPLRGDIKYYLSSEVNILKQIPLLNCAKK